MRNLLLLLFIVFWNQLGIAQIDEIRLEVEKIIRHDTEINFERVPGFSIAIIDGDSIFSMHFGSDDANSTQLLTDSSIFEIGSVTKVFTATLVQVLVDENIIAYNDKANSFLPIEDQNPRLNELTIKDLIYHQSGFPKLPYFFGKKEKEVQNPYAYYTKSDLLKFYREFVPNDRTGYNYSHCNYGLLEILLENKMQTSFQELLDKYVFQELGMNDSFVSTNDEIDQLVITKGYDRAIRETGHWTFSAFAGSEGMKSSLRDLSSFIFTCVNREEVPILSSINRTFEIGTVTNFNENVFIAKAWHVIDQGKNYSIITHTGNTSGHHAFIGLVKETGTGVVILANSAFGTEDLGFLILRMINHNWKRKV